MSNERFDRWMEPRLGTVLLVVGLLILLGVAGGMPRGVGSDARLLLGVVGDAARFVAHVVDEAEQHLIWRTPDEEQQHLAMAVLTPGCTPASMPYGIQVRLAERQFAEIEAQLPTPEQISEWVADAMKGHPDWLEATDWSSLKGLEALPSAEELRSLKELAPGFVPSPHPYLEVRAARQAPRG